MRCKYIRPHFAWIVIILCTYIFAGLLLWLADIKIFQALVFILLLASVLTVTVVCLIWAKAEQKREEDMIAFLSNPDMETESRMLRQFSSASKDWASFLVERIYAKEEEMDQYRTMLQDYEKYVEVWAHEIKLPLSLLTLILDNRREELPGDVLLKLDYVRNQIQHQISQILCYYRIRSEKNDFLFESVDCKEVIASVLEDYSPLLHEKQMQVTMEVGESPIYTDARSFEFIVGQIIANSVKYSGEHPSLHISMKLQDHATVLCFKDNGCGVKSCDLPHIFYKGFTGDSGESRKKSTGMGLYLVKQLADKLKIDVRADSKWQEGFEIALHIPSGK